MLDFVTWLITGALAGWVAGFFLHAKTRQGLYLHLLVGIVGAVLGGWVLMPLFQAPSFDADAFSAGSLPVALVGAVVLLAIYEQFRRSREP